MPLSRSLQALRGNSTSPSLGTPPPEYSSTEDVRVRANIIRLVLLVFALPEKLRAGFTSKYPKEYILNFELNPFTVWGAVAPRNLSSIRSVS